MHALDHPRRYTLGLACDANGYRVAQGTWGHLWSGNGHSIAAQEILRILIQSIKEN